MTISEYLITAAEALRSGAAEDIVKLAMRSDGHPPARIETMIRWCKLHNERTTNEQQADDLSGEAGETFSSGPDYSHPQ